MTDEVIRLEREDNDVKIFSKNKLIVGHSPDFIEAILMKWIFNVRKGEVSVPSWLKSDIAKRNGVCVRRIGFKKV